MKKLLFLLLIPMLSMAEDAESLAKQKACLGCHSIQHIGISYPPAFARVAERHRGDPDYIKETIRYGKGKMPAHPMLADAEISLLANWILSIKEVK